MSHDVCFPAESEAERGVFLFVVEVVAFEGYVLYCSLIGAASEADFVMSKIHLVYSAGQRTGQG